MGLGNVASLIGKPITINKMTINKHKLSYAIVFIEVEMPAKLPNELRI